jgi:hypothetical protein
MRRVRKTGPRGRGTGKGAGGSSESRLDDLIEEATMDAYDREEQVTGLYTMLEDHLKVPFETHLLGMDVTVEKVHLSNAGEIAAICRRGRFRQRISILDLPLPDPPPKGAEWVEAYRRWSFGK